MPKRIVIIEDDESSRFLYRFQFKHIADLQIVGEFEDAEEALLHIPRLAPDLVIVDYSLPGMSGIECIEKLKQFPHIKIVLVTGHDLGYFESILQCSDTLDVVQKGWSDEVVKKIIDFCM